MNSPDIEAAFRILTTELEIEIVEPTPLDTSVEALLDHFMELLAAAGPVDMHDVNALKNTRSLLTDRINRFFSHSEELTYETEVIVNGNTIVLMVDETEVEIEANFLDRDSKIYGRVGGLYVGAIPDECEFADPDDREDDSDDNYEVETIPFGLALVLDEATISDIYGRTEAIPENITICIPLNYPSLRLTKL